MCAHSVSSGPQKLAFQSKAQASRLQRWLIINLRWCFGIVFCVNFVVFWALPIGLQGNLWKGGMKNILQPIFRLFDENKSVRAFALNTVYSKEITYHALPLWLILAYNFAWVGPGGRGMGTAYTFAHQEGHHRGGGMYKPYIARSIGNMWENWMGLLYGNVPYNFSTSHIFLHHRLNAGKGDPFYMWDIDRSSISSFILYAHRVFVYMSGYSSLKVFRQMSDSNKTMKDNYYMLRRGMIIFWIIMPVIIIGFLVACGCSLGSSLTFYFFIILEPLCCMSFFLALINVPFHGFVEFDEAGRHIPCVNSAAIIDGEDDSFGEDDHMTHHYFTNVYHRDLKAHQSKQKETWIKYHASVFKKMSILECSVLILLNKWKLLAEKHYVDFSGTLSVDQVAAMLERRAKTIEMTYEQYEFDFLPTIRERAEALVKKGQCASVDQALKELAHIR